MVNTIDEETVAEEAVVEEGITSVVEEEVDLEEARFQTKRVIEALLFASQDPITLRKISDLTSEIHTFEKKELKEMIAELQEEYEKEQRAFRIDEIAQGFAIRSKPEYGHYIEMLYKSRKPDRITHAQAEVLAIVAYKQPITRAQVEEVRGVDCTSQLQALMEKDLVEQVGKLEVPGRPTLYGVTKTFLTHFGLKDLKNLPKLEATN